MPRYGIRSLKFDSEIYLNTDDILRYLDKQAEEESDFCQESNTEYAGTELEDTCQVMFQGSQLALKQLRASFTKCANDAEEDETVRDMLHLIKKLAAGESIGLEDWSGDCE